MDDEKINDSEQDVLLVHDKENKKLEAVQGVGRNGELQTVDPEKKNENQIMRVDKNGDIFSNYFSNFRSQLKNPTHFSFFRVPLSQVEDFAAKIDKYLLETTKEAKAFLEKVTIKETSVQNQNNKNNMETTGTNPEGEYRYKPEQIDWDAMKNLGLSKEYLEKRQLLDPLLRGYKTNELVPLNLNLGAATTKMDARLALQTNDDGKVIFAIHGIRREPNLNFEFFGHRFSQADKQNLLETGNMGRVVNLTNPNDGSSIPSIISIDKLTNELVALRTEWIKVPDEIKGITLSDEQKQVLSEGRPLYLQDMMSSKNEPFSATVQINADKRNIEYFFDRENSQTQNQANQEGQKFEAPREFRKTVLDDGQYEKFKDGQTVYLDNLVDKKGQTYQGYITFSKESGKVNFEFPNQYNERVKPTEAHKTQTAVNSEGKTNEATKNIKEPLKPGQQGPKDKQQQEQQEKPESSAKSKGRKM